MAEKKTTQPAKQLSLPEQLQAARTGYQNVQKSFIEGTLQNPHALKAAKKEVARVLTKINQEKGAK